MPPRFRVRERLDQRFEPWEFKYDYNSDHFVFARDNSSRWTHRSVISDVTQDNRSFKPVAHEHQFHASSVNGGSWTNGNGATITQVSDWVPLPIPEHWISGVDRLPFVSSGRVALAVDNAFTAMSKQVPEEVNILNFTYELRELGDLIPSLAESLSRTVSGQYLNWQFGVKPLLSDIKKLGAISKAVQDRLAYLRQTWGKRVRVGHYEEFSEEPSKIERTASTFSDGEVTVTPYSYRGFFRAGGYIFHTLDRLYGMEATLRGASGALGLLNPVEAVWNAIPFSFVLDWFGRIGNVLSRLDTLQPFPGTWNCIDFGYSTTEMLSYEVKLYWTGSNPKIRIGNGIVQLRRYERHVGLPVNPTQLIGTGSLTTSQQLLGVALLNSTRKH